MTLYLIRHAQPAVPSYSNLYPGPELGPEGQRQAEWVAAQLSGKPIGLLWASDYPRVLSTLQPYLQANPHMPVQTSQALWEREASVETHGSLQARVYAWCAANWPSILQQDSAIFSHCGPLNMILEYLDPNKDRLPYPFTCPYGCHTPLAGIWEIQISPTSISGTLGTCPLP